MVNKPNLNVNRRQLLQAAGSVGSALPLAAHANAPAPADEMKDAAAYATVILHDPRVPIDATVQAQLTRNGARHIALTDDPVRLWRGDLKALLSHPGTRLFGVTLWADFLIVRGLAAESRRHVQFERLEPTTGTITFLIA
jgi:hypothetical protein